ncbi:MAG: DUF6599 family protein [Bacteroidales bacterium]
MIRKNIILLIASLAFYSGLYAQNGSSDFSPSDIKITRERDFTGTALYGFMNGGSDLFLEYGFRDLKALELTYKGTPFTVEVYRMPTPEDAFGIYSQHTFKCIPADSRFYLDCTSSRQFQAAEGNLYISVVFDPAAPMAKNFAYLIAKHYTTLYGSGGKPAIPDQIAGLMNPGDEKSLTLKYATGPISLSNINSSLMPLLEEVKGYKAWILKGKGTGDIILIRFGSSEDFSAFSKGLTSSGEDKPAEILSSGENALLLRMK